MVAEFLPDFAQSLYASLILYGIMQQGRNRLVLGAAMFDDKRRNDHQMRNVWDRRALPCLSTMQPVGVLKGFIKSVCQQ